MRMSLENDSTRGGILEEKWEEMGINTMTSGKREQDGDVGMTRENRPT